MEFCLHPWISITIHGHPWMGPWKSMDVCGTIHRLPWTSIMLWFSMDASADFHGLPLCYGLPYLHGHPWIYRHGKEVNHPMAVHGTINMTKK